MMLLDAGETRARLPLPALIEAVRSMFTQGCTVPLRHHHHFATGDAAEGTLLLMPAWQPAGFQGVKIVNVVPGNASRGVPALTSTYLLSDAASGAALAVIDGNEVTTRRTVAASALAAGYLARQEASNMLVIGAGRVARLLPEAHRCVRPIKSVAVFDINPANAEAMVAYLQTIGFEAETTSNLAEAAARADIISCATLSREPIVMADWLSPGTHLDLIGSFTPAMREIADGVLLRSSIFVDTETALTESGDLVQPIAAGVIDASAVRATLDDLCKGRHAGRLSDDEITLFKSVGTALEDLAAAIMVYQA
jgi:ornithine cyclodeaminase/alanine dehydrogenase-like protein (mu-crystallin family)